MLGLCWVLLSCLGPMLGFVGLSLAHLGTMGVSGTRALARSITVHYITNYISFTNYVTLQITLHCLHTFIHIYIYVYTRIFMYKQTVKLV